MEEENVREQKMTEEKSTGQKYRPAWRSFYKHMVAMVACLVLVAVLSVKLSLAWSYQKWLWIFFLVFMLYVSLDMVYRRFRVVLIVAPDKIAKEEGFIGRDSTEVSTKSIRSIQVRQRVMQRILKTGSIIVTSSGDNEEISVSDMPNPYAIREVMQTYERTPEKIETLSAPAKTADAKETKGKNEK